MHGRCNATVVRTLPVSWWEVVAVFFIADVLPMSFADPPMGESVRISTASEGVRKSTATATATATVHEKAARNDKARLRGLMHGSTIGHSCTAQLFRYARCVRRRLIVILLILPAVLVMLVLQACGSTPSTPKATSSENCKDSDGPSAATVRQAIAAVPIAVPGSILGRNRPRTRQEMPLVLGADHPDDRQRVHSPAAAVLRPQRAAGHADPEPEALHHRVGARR